MPMTPRVGLDNLRKLAGRENWRRWGEKQAVVVAVETRSYVTHEQDNAVQDDFIRRLEQLRQRQEQFGYQPQGGVTLIPPVTPVPAADRPEINKVPDRVIDNVQGPWPEVPDEPAPKREFYGLKCTSERPPDLDRHSGWPTVIGRS